MYRHIGILLQEIKRKEDMEMVKKRWKKKKKKKQFSIVIKNSHPDTPGNI